MHKTVLPMLTFILLLGLPARADDAPTKHYLIKGDAITFQFGATDDELAILDTLPDLKSIDFGGGGGWSGRDPRTFPWAITDAGFARLGHLPRRRSPPRRPRQPSRQQANWLRVRCGSK